MPRTLQQVREVLSPQVLAIGLTASMGGFLFGSDTGQLSGYIIMPHFMDRFAEEQPDGTHEWSMVRLGLVVGMMSIGALVGSLASGLLSEWLGRRKAMLILVLVFNVGNTVFITSQYKWRQVVVARFLSGFTVGGCSSLVPVYVSETVPKEVRGALVATYQLFVTFGILTSYLVNFGLSHVHSSAQFRGAIAIGYAWSNILGLGMLFLPESPRWLLAHGQPDKCREALRFIAGKTNRDNEQLLEAEFEEIESSVRESAKAGKTLLAAFDPKGKALYRTLLGLVLQSLQQLAGANYFLYYGTRIFKSVGIDDPFVTQIVLGAVNVVCSFPGLWFIERFGRRKPLLYGGLWQALWLFIFGAVGSETDPNSKATGVVMILSACLFLASFASTWGPGIWVAVGEMYPLHTRSSCASIATTANWAWNFFLTFGTPFITQRIQFRYGYVFAGCNLLAVLTVYFFYYESSNLTLEQVDNMYNDPTVKPWKSEHWVAPGVTKRRGLAVDVEQGEKLAGIDSSPAHELMASTTTSACGTEGSIRSVNV